MVNRFEATLDNYLAGGFVKSLRQVLKSEGFEETLSVPEPLVVEFQNGSQLLTVQVADQGPHSRSIVVESESADLKPLIGAAAKETVVMLSEELLGILRWVDQASVQGRIDACVADLLG